MKVSWCTVISEFKVQSSKFKVQSSELKLTYSLLLIFIKISFPRVFYYFSIHSQADLDAARRERNKCFNEPVVGLVDVYQTAKAAAKARYGVTSAEFKSIKGLTFTRIK